MPNNTSLTAHLLNPTLHPSTTHLLTQATTHNFLAQAGQGTLPAKTLTKWLAQDVLYTRAYVRFLGGMLKRLRLPSDIYISTVSSQTTLEYRVFDLLVGALTNIQREMKFFEHTCGEYALDLDTRAQAEPVTRSYADMFGSVPDKGLLHGLVVLWATELCYLKAWRYALKKQEEGGSKKSEGGTGGDEDARARRALEEKFIPNWSSREFEDFVVECGRVLDEVARDEGLHTILVDRIAVLSNQEEKARKIVVECEELFNYVIHLESNFWPEV